MPRIGRFPPFGKRFFRRARKLIGSCHFAHFWRAVVALAAMQRLAVRYSCDDGYRALWQGPNAFPLRRGPDSKLLAYDQREQD